VSTSKLSKLTDHIFTPPQMARIAIEDAQQAVLNRNRLMPFFLKDLGEYMLPLRGGALCVIMAQTHNGKSFIMNRWEMEFAKYLEKVGRDEIIIHVDVENVIEDQAYTLMKQQGVYGREITDWKEAEAMFISASIKVGKIPVYRIGVRSGHGDFTKLYLSNVAKMIEYIQGKNPEFSMLGREVKIAAIFADYLQAFPVDPEVSRAEHKDQRRLQVRADVFTCRNMAARFAVPVILGVQAKQELKGQLGPNMLIPGLYDGMETADIATRTDLMWSMWMPKTTHSVGDRLRHKDLEFDVTEGLIWLRLLKQRIPGGGKSGLSWPMYVDWDGAEQEIVTGTKTGSLISNPKMKGYPGYGSNAD